MPASLADAPGIDYDGQHRIFRLRCRNCLYAFRVDDARNLEHLYWGPPLPNGDDLTYLVRSHVPAPFDPRGTVSVASALGLEELNDMENVQDVVDKWKVFTKAKDEEGTDKDQFRRLENASWRLWHRERNRGGDLNVTDNQVAQALGGLSVDEKHEKTVSFKPGLKEQTGPTDVVPPVLTSAPAKGMRRNMTTAYSFANLAHEGAGPLSPRSAAKGVRSIPTSPRMSRVPSAVPSPMAGSFVDLTNVDAPTNWGALDPEVVGKNTKLLEFSDQGTGDYRDPSFKLTFSKDGSSVCPLSYKRYRILEGKVPLPSPMPGVYTDSTDEASTLIVEMEDHLNGLKFLLYYTVLHEYDLITRRTVVVNQGNAPVTLKHVVSGTFDFDTEGDYYLTQLAGGWAREREVVTNKLDYGMKVVKSSRGASSHQFNPFIAISPNSEPQEDDGEVFGFALVYSGNFAAATEITEYGRLRVNMGINPDGFTWHLNHVKGNNSFSTPEVIMTYSSQGLGNLSRIMHRAIRERLVPRNWRYKVPPVLLNTWEAAYFDVTHEVVLAIGRAAAKANIELLVLDDGWFGVRNNTMSGLGDWHPNLDKFPFGVDGIARAVNELGLKFGIWVEPEMVSIDSDLYRAHPDWCLCVPTRTSTMGRNQLVLDFSRQVVRDLIYEQLHQLLSSANIEYVKWDMNRHLTEVFSQEWHAERQGEISHRFILGVYEVLTRLTDAFPNVLFETCSGGGGRFDCGMLYFSPQIWTSDNTDALSRAAIQYGTSLAYPASSMGAHVSAVPNHQTLRHTPMKTRAVVAMSGTFGYELDPRGFTEEDLIEIKGYIDLQKRIAPLVYEGDMYRLWSPFKSDSAAWMFVSRDKRRAIVIAVNIRRVVGRLLPRLKLRGLNPKYMYRVEELCPGTVARNPDTGAIDHAPMGVYQYGVPLSMTGCTLRRAGLPVKFLFDADSIFFELNVEDLSDSEVSSGLENGGT